MDECRAADVAHLVHKAHKMFEDYIEARDGKLITTKFQPALVHNELLQERVLEPAVEKAVIYQVHMALASPAVEDTLSPVITEMCKTNDGVDLFTSASAHTLLCPALLTPETLLSIATHLVTIPEFKEAIISPVLAHIHEGVTYTSVILEKRAPKSWAIDADATPCRNDDVHKRRSKWL